MRDWPDDALSMPTTTVTAGTEVNETTSTTTDGAVTATTTKQQSGGTTATTAKASTATIPAPQPGTYTYDAEVDAPAFEDEPASHEKFAVTSTWSVNRSATSVDATEKLGSTQEDGALVNVFRIEAAGVSVVETYDDSDDDSRCKYTPPLLDLKAPYTVGQKWRSTATCKMPDDYVDLVTNEGEITGTKTLTIGGRSINGIVVRVVQTTKETDPELPDEPYEFKVTITTTYDPATLLPLQSEQRHEEDGFAFTFRRTLRSTTPK